MVRPDDAGRKASVMAKRKIEFELKNSPDESDTLCEKLEEFGEALNLSKKTVFQVCFAVDELFTNTISYGFCDEREHTVRVAASLENDVMVIVVEDDAKPFDLNEVKPPNTKCSCEDREIGGLGIYLTKNLMDDVRYKRAGRKNIVTMKKRVEYCDEPADAKRSPNADGKR